MTKRTGGAGFGVVATAAVAAHLALAAVFLDSRAVTPADAALVTGLYVLAGAFVVAAACFLLRYVLTEDALGTVEADERREPTSSG